MTFQVLTQEELYDRVVDYNAKDPFAKMEQLEEELKYFGNIIPTHS